MIGSVLAELMRFGGVNTHILALELHDKVSARRPRDLHDFSELVQVWEERRSSFITCTFRRREASDGQVVVKRCSRIRSVPLNSGLPSSISAMMQPADQMSTGTERTSGSASLWLFCSCTWDKRSFTGLCVAHPVQDNLWRSVPAGHNVTGHLCIRLPRQAKIQDLGGEN